MANEIKDFLLNERFIARTSGGERYYEKKIDNEFSIIAIISEANKNWITISVGILWNTMQKHYKKIYKNEFKEYKNVMGRQLQCILLTSADNIKSNLKNIIGLRSQPVKDNEIKIIQNELFKIIKDFENIIKNGNEKIIEKSIQYAYGIGFEIIPIAIFLIHGAQEYYKNKEFLKSLITNKDYVARFDSHLGKVEHYFSIPPN